MEGSVYWPIQYAYGVLNRLQVARLSCTLILTNARGACRCYQVSLSWKGCFLLVDIRLRMISRDQVSRLNFSPFMQLK